MLAPTASTFSAVRQDRRLDSVWLRPWFFGGALWFLDAITWSLIYAALIHALGTTQTTPIAWWTSGLAGLVCTIGAFYVIGGYSARRDMLSLIFAAEYVLAVLSAIGISFVLIYALTSYTQNIKPSRGVLLLTFLCAPTLSLMGRRAMAGWHRTHNQAREFLVIGAGERAKSFYRYYKKSGLNQELRFVSDFSFGEIDGEGSPSIFGQPMHAVRNLSRRTAGIIIAEESPNINAELTAELVRIHFEWVPVYTLESFYDHFWQKVPVMTLDPAWPLQKGFPLSTETPYTSIKRVLDFLAAFLALCLLLPLLILIALLVRAESAGPVIFQQERMGWHRRTFSVLKFRTMLIRAEEGSLYTESNDRRITRVGYWLRKFRLDELPQLWNVLVGDMSLIGPRAEWVKCVALYEDPIPAYHFRHLVRPGITGWAQVNYPYGSNLEDAIQKLTYDLYYIRHYSLKLDAMIVLKTIHVVFLAKGT